MTTGGSGHDPAAIDLTPRSRRRPRGDLRGRAAHGVHDPARRSFTRRRGPAHRPARSTATPKAASASLPKWPSGSARAVLCHQI